MSDMNMTMPMATTPVTAATPTPTNSAMGVYEAGVTPWRNNWYKGMTTLSSLSIQHGNYGLLWECDLEGDWRGTDHGPLIVPNVMQKNGTTCSMLLIGTMSNDIYAFDYDKSDPVTGKGRLLWKQRIGNPVINDPKFDMYLINQPFWGQLSQGYVDIKTQTYYVVCVSSPDQTFAKCRYYLHALNILDGSDRVPPLDISTAVYQAATGPIAHDASPRKQRAGLAFCTYEQGARDIIYVCDSTFAMLANVAHGFLIACDVTGVRNNMAMNIYCCTTMSAPPYAGAGIWMAGGAPNIDANGDVTLVCANGAFDPTKGCYGNATVKFRLMPAANNQPPYLQAEDWICFYSDAGRTGKDPTIPWIGLIGNFSGQQDGMDMTAPNDQDLGCAAAPHFPKSVTGFTDDLDMACGKDGVAYLIYHDNMGKTLIGDFASDKIQANYAKAAAITGATYYPGNFDITPTNLGAFSTTVGGFTHHQHSTPPWYMSPDHGLLVYFGGENGPVRVFNISQDATSKQYSFNYLGTGLEIASPGVPAPGGMPGTFMCISSIGDTKDTAALHCLQPYGGDANKAIVHGRYIVYGANWIANGQLVKIYDSLNDPNCPAFDHCKFGVATPALDKVAVPTYDRRVLVFGMKG